MKRILIAGANSYIGTSFQNYILENYKEDYRVDTVDMMGDAWKEKDFSGYDTVFHVAGIAHSDGGRIGKEKEKLYYAVNTELTIETATKAKADGVKQFVFMSSAIVYGESARIGKEKVIDGCTLPSPKNCYGDSKLQAENGLNDLQDSDFNVAVLRPPMIYGKGSKGNYPALSKFAQKFPIFPYVRNQRSMLYIENLCEFVRCIIENEMHGIYFPQNAEYANTSELVQWIAEAHGKKVHLVKGFGWAVKLLGLVCGRVRKAFGNFCYDQALSEYPFLYQIYDLKNSIKKTETES